MVPVVDVVLPQFYLFEFLFRVVDERTQVAEFRLAYLVAENLVHLPLDVSRCVFQHVLEGVVRPVYVGEEMFRALGQVEYRLEVDYLGAGVRHCGERLCEQLQVSEVGAAELFLVVFHCTLALNSFLSVFLAVLS